MKQRMRFLSALFIAGLVIAACGSSDDSSRTAQPAQNADEPWWNVEGSCDTSAIFALSDSGFVFAVDENDVLRRVPPGAYPANGGTISAASVQEWADVASEVEKVGGIDGTPHDDNTVLQEKKGTPREMDLEGVSQIQDQVFWIGSHGLSSSGKYRPNRMILAATNVPTATNTGTLYGTPRDLLPAILDEPQIGPILKPLFQTEAGGTGTSDTGTPPKSGGFNIEGLAADGDDLLIGLRSPLDSGRAWILRLSNPKEIVDNAEASPTISVAAQLDLEGRGIRAMTKDGSGTDWLLVAGPIGDPPPQFALYTWDGNSESSPKLLPYTPPVEIRPEAIAVQNGTVLIGSDDGTEPRDGSECKEADIAQKYFRVISVERDALNSAN